MELAVTVSHCPLGDPLAVHKTTVLVSSKLNLSVYLHLSSCSEASQTVHHVGLFLVSMTKLSYSL